MLTSWDKEDESWERHLHLISSQGFSSTSIKPKASNTFYHFRKGSLLSQLSTLLVEIYDTDSQNRRFLKQCGKVFSEGSDLARRVSLGGMDIMRGLFHSSPPQMIE